MPFGTKTDADGQEIHFNEVHKRSLDEQCRKTPDA